MGGAVYYVTHYIFMWLHHKYVKNFLGNPHGHHLCNPILIKAIIDQPQTNFFYKRDQFSLTIVPYHGSVINTWLYALWLTCMYWPISACIVQTSGVEVSWCALAICLTEPSRSGLPFCEKNE